MDTPEFEKINYELGIKNLEPLGFEYKNKQWSHVNEDRQLSFCLAKDKNSPHFKIKYLTISLRHFGVKRIDMVDIKAFEDISQWGAVQISPKYLEGTNAANWHYVNPLKSLHEARVYMPIYYGGKPSIFGGVKGSVQSEKIVKQFGAEYISEKYAIKLLNSSQVSVAKQGLNWANAMTRREVLNQLQEHNEDWFSEKQWIEAYERVIET